MRPHHLRLTAFGAFPGTVDLDLDALGDNGLFLLHGETGAGKTTLLDALGFALYGRVPGARGKAKRLRSDHAAPAVRTEVTLEVSLAGRRLRVTRSPEQARPKLRGSGTTAEPAKVLLEEHGPQGWRALSTRVGEADAEIAELLGMSADQFFQVVLLPQGEFARFLRADSEDRGRLLERLFGTDRFRAAEAWLAEQRRSTARRVDEARARVSALAARVAQVVDLPVPDGDVGRGWAAELAAHAAAAADAASADAGRCERVLDAALSEVRAAEQLADRQRRRAQAQERLAELTASVPRIAAVSEELAAAARASEVAATLTESDRAAQRLHEARAAESAARAAIAESDVAPGVAPDADAADLGAAAIAQRERVGRLEALRDLTGRSASEEALARRARERAGELDGRRAGYERQLAALPERRATLVLRRHAALDAAARLPAVRAQAARFREAVAVASALAAARGDEDRLRRHHVVARERAVSLRERAQSLREARFDAMIAELAAGLVDGAPCPVCGALEHPDPSEVRGARVTRQQEEDAATAADAAATESEELGRRHAAALARVGDLTDRFAPGGLACDEANPAILTAACQDLEAEAAELALSADALGDCDVALAALEDEARDVEASRAAVVEQSRAALAEAAAAERRAAADHAVLRGQLGGADDLPAALSAAADAAEALDTAADAARAVSLAAAELARAGAAAEVAAISAGFSSAATARAALRAPDWRAEAQAEVDAHREALAAVHSALADPDLCVALGPPAALTTAIAAVASARAAHEIAVAAADRAQHRAEQLAALAPDLAEALAALAPTVERADVVRRLADLVAGQGQNALRMTLSSFVLAARLEEVAAAATERLLRMTQGRYALVHTDASRGGGRAGLGLLARDSWTGRDRDTSTLSGGETFLASLALALGLADVVTAEAGGAPVEALFVDEGFGALDEDTLDDVMGVLDGLREGGRMVGIVSHVAELRSRIPAQVHVRKARHGSDARVVAC